MGKYAYNAFGNSTEQTRKYLVGASFLTAGIIACGDTDTPDALIPATTTGALDSLGLTNDVATYSATPAVNATGIVTVSYQPGNVYQFRASGGATDGTSLGIVTETAGDVSTPDTVTGTLPTANSMVGGTVWRYPGEGNHCSLRDSRFITTHTSTTSLAVVVDFERAINVGDKFIMVPWTIYPGDGTDTSDGNTNIQFSTLLGEADASIATGTGAIVAVVDILMKGANDTYVLFTLPDHPYLVFVA